MAAHWLLGIEPVRFEQKMTAREKMGNANIKYSAEVVSAALKDLDAGASVKATAEKHGITFRYLYYLRNNRRRRRDAQAKR